MGENYGVSERQPFVDQQGVITRPWLMVLQKALRKSQAQGSDGSEAAALLCVLAQTIRPRTRPSSIADTHAHRANYPASAFPGAFYFESDRGYSYLSIGAAWYYAGGLMSGVLADRPADLGLHDAAALFHATDALDYRWDGAAWVSLGDVRGGASLTDVNRIPKVSATGTLGESAVSDDGTTVTATARNVAITGTLPEYKATITGGTQPARMGCFFLDGYAYWSVNLFYTGTEWHLDDTGQAGLAIRLFGSTITGFKATAGANPRVLTQTFSFDDALVGFFGATAASKQTLNAYTTNAQGAYSGIANTAVGNVFAQLTDLNALRVAYENLRASYDDLRTKIQTSTLVG